MRYNQMHGYYRATTHDRCERCNSLRKKHDNIGVLEELTG